MYEISFLKLQEIVKEAYMDSRIADYTALSLVIIGAINWGLIGFFKFDLVDFLFGEMSIASRIVYAIVGIAGIYLTTVFGRIRALGKAYD